MCNNHRPAAVVLGKVWPLLDVQSFSMLMCVKLCTLFTGFRRKFPVLSKKFQLASVVERQIAA